MIWFVRIDFSSNKLFEYIIYGIFMYIIMFYVLGNWRFYVYYSDSIVKYDIENYFCEFGKKN